MTGLGDNTLSLRWNTGDLLRVHGGCASQHVDVYGLVKHRFGVESTAHLEGELVTPSKRFHTNTLKQLSDLQFTVADQTGINLGDLRVTAEHNRIRHALSVCVRVDRCAAARVLHGERGVVRRDEGHGVTVSV